MRANSGDAEAARSRDQLDRAAEAEVMRLLERDVKEAEVLELLRAVERADVERPQAGALIIGVLEDGPRRFTEIRDAMGVTPKVLTETLRALERDGIVTRTAYAEIPPRVEYELTSLGKTLRKPLAAIRDWAEEHLNEIVAARERRAADAADA